MDMKSWSSLNEGVFQQLTLMTRRYLPSHILFLNTDARYKMQNEKLLSLFWFYIEFH